MIWQKWVDIAIWKRSLIAIILAVAFGFFFKEASLEFKPLGDTFLRLLRLVIVPLIFISLLHSIINLKNTKLLARLAFKSSFWFVLTTAIAISLAIIASAYLKPGVGSVVDYATTYTPKNVAPPTIMSTILGVIPDNFLKAMLNADVLQVIFLSIVLGITLIKINSKHKELAYKVIDVANDVILYIVSFIAQLLPIGVFFLIAYTTAAFGYDILIKSAYIIAIVMVLLIVQLYVVFPIILKLKGCSVKKFIKGSFEAVVIACATGSSNATLPTTMSCAKKMGIPKLVRSFVIPFGCTVNMNGSAIYQATAVIFIAQILGMELSLTQYFIILGTTIISAIGTAGVSGGGLVAITLVMTSVGLPIESLALVIAIDRILDLPRTSTNVGGDLMVAQILSAELSQEELAESEKEEEEDADLVVQKA